MANRPRAEIARRDLQPEEWQRVAAEHGKLPRVYRSALARKLAEWTGLSIPSVYRRLAGQFPGKTSGPKVVSTAEQRRLVVEALEKNRGRISPLDLWTDVLGAPVRPSLQTVRRLVRRWRAEQVKRLQLPLPFTEHTVEDVGRDVEAVLMRVLGGKGSRG